MPVISKKPNNNSAMCKRYNNYTTIIILTIYISTNTNAIFAAKLIQKGITIKKREITPVKGIFPTNYKLIK
jgi:hypothetical protein